MAAIDDDVDVVLLGISLERLADIVLKRVKDVLLALVVSRLSIFALTLKIFFQRLERIRFA